MLTGSLQEAIVILMMPFVILAAAASIATFALMMVVDLIDMAINE
jgi:hypothetical protein